MSRREELLEVYRHKNIGYVPSRITDINFVKPKYVNERPEGRDGYDWFGVHWTYQPENKSNTLSHGYGHVITDITNWREQVKFPDLTQYDWEKYGAEETANWDRENKVSMVMIINGTFERSHHLLGFENALVAMLTEPDDYCELLDAIADYKCQLIGIIAKYYKPDIIMMHDDYGAKDRMLMSPETWRECIKPRLARLVKTAHDNGLIYEHHSCGYIEPIIGDLVEIGVDSLNPIQPCNNLKAIKEKYGKQLTLAGGFDSQGVLDNPKATEEEIRANIRETFDLLAPGGSFICQTVTLTFDYVPIMVDEHKKLARLYADT